MESIGMMILALIAILIHVLVGYHAILKHTVVFIKSKLRFENNNKSPIHIQEKMAFIVWPVLGYVLWYFFRDMGGQEFELMPIFGVIQFIAFTMYFIYRLAGTITNYLIRVIFACFFLIAILSCLLLIAKLFCYYLVCVTVGWILVVPPFVALSYFALFQVVMFLSIAIANIVSQDVQKEIAYNKIQCFTDLYTWLFSAWGGLLIYILSMLVFVVLVALLLHADFMGPYQITWKNLTYINTRFLW